MIYNTFKDVERNHDYANEYISEARERAIKYITDVITEVGSIGAMIDNQPALFVLERLNGEEKIIFYYKIGQRRELSILGIEELYDICKQVRKQHLVVEYGDEEEAGKEG